MRKKLLVAAAAVFTLALGLEAPREASAIPAFARQTGLACQTCHFQHFPTLNAYGRTFKAGGYTQVGGQSLVEGEHLSLPSTLNASLITKVRYQKRSGENKDDGTAGGATGSASELNKGELQFPDEAALLIGGRGGEHVGFLLEASLKDGDSRFTSFKMPFSFNVASTDLLVIPFSTDSQGAAYGLELLNTGALRLQRPIEHRSEFSAQQYIGTDGNATGLTLAAVNKMGFFNYTPYYKEHGNAAVGPFINYFRAGVTPQIGGWDTAVGLASWSGTSKTGATDAPNRVHAEAWALDAQAQGEVGSMPLGVYFSYAKAAKSKVGEVANTFNASTNKNKSAVAINGELGVIPHRLTAALGYRVGKDGDSNNDGMQRQNALTMGFVYEAMQNLELQLNNSWYTGDAKPDTNDGTMLTTLMLFAAF